MTNKQILKLVKNIKEAKNHLFKDLYKGGRKCGCQLVNDSGSGFSAYILCDVAKKMSGFNKFVYGGTTYWNVKEIK
jgi:hypothetical protein